MFAYLQIAVHFYQLFHKNVFAMKIVGRYTSFLLPKMAPLYPFGNVNYKNVSNSFKIMLQEL